MYGTLFAGCPKKSFSVEKFSLSSAVADEIFKNFQDKGYTGTRYNNKHRRYSVTVTQNDLYYCCLNHLNVTSSTLTQT